MLYIEKWWTDKYRSSPKSADFKAYTYEELLIEFFSDMYLGDRKKLWADDKSKYGEVRLPEVGDDLVDKWEEQYQKGIFPDLTEGLPESERVKIHAIQEAERKNLAEKRKTNLESALKSKVSGADDYMKEFSDVY